MSGFDAVLIANRGEIACRIVRSAHALGLAAVAVYSDADRDSPHVRMADRAVRIGPPPARESYLLSRRIVAAALEAGAGAIHPGYGFLSESTELVEACESAGVTFVGPDARHLSLFGQKHTAREAARAAGVPLLPGSGLLLGVDDAVSWADRIGWPVMLKATGGGGGIGMARCSEADQLVAAFDGVSRLAAANFGDSGVFVERLVDSARHVEVQLFGDGAGRVVVLGDRDCSLQRRNQKVIEEAPAPNLPDTVREQIAGSARDLAMSVGYRSAGTVEFVYDADRAQAYFLEVNTRLQVEHPVTEAVFGVDLVEWMLRLANGDSSFLDGQLVSRGHAIEARLYAEDPSLDFRPSVGLITEARFPDDTRVDGWVEAGTEVSSFYDPLLAKVIVHDGDRESARQHLREAITGTRIGGIETNLGFIAAALTTPAFVRAEHTTVTLDTVADPTHRIEIRSPGTETTVQDWPGRLGYWEVGVPPSGPMDDLSFRLGNVALGNPEGAAGLECVLSGPVLAVSHDTTVCITGAPVRCDVDGVAVPMWSPFIVPAGSSLRVGPIRGPGLRSYVLFAGGLDVPLHLGSASTFTLGGFGGHGGRALRTGDVLHPLDVAGRGTSPIADVPDLSSEWQIGVLEGPHGAPEFFTPADIGAFFAASWQVHFNSARTGVRLIGPKPLWARQDGGEAGLHPSNIHDTAYAIATIDFTGDTPIVLGPDGPSLGGFVCPATVAISERWKLGQLRPGDSVRFVPISGETASERRDSSARHVAGRRHPLRSEAAPSAVRTGLDPAGGVLLRSEGSEDRPAVTYRRAGEDYLLVEFGPMALDIGLRMRVQSLIDSLMASGTRGIVDLTPGIRSLQVHVDPTDLPLSVALDLVNELEGELPPSSSLFVPSRRVELPLSWDDPSTRDAIERYMTNVRDDAPWCPWNIEFIRRINGLGSVDDVHRIVFDAEYLVMGLGDVYLGAPVATPVDPRHRLVTTKYNPARTWTPENAVGIGGAYLCIYGMEGPGGYQFVGRTVPVWSRWPRRTTWPDGAPHTPALLRHFDRISWYPVGAEELLDLRADMAAGRLDLVMEDGTFELARYEAFLASESTSISAFRERQVAAFDEERDRWRASGEFERVGALVERSAPVFESVPESDVVAAPLPASVWRVDAAPGDVVEADSVLFVLEAMKLEIAVYAGRPGVVDRILVSSGDQVDAEQPLAVLRADDER